MPDQFYRPVNSQNEGIALAHTIHGAPVMATAQPNADPGNSNIALAWGTYSTAPYLRRRLDVPGKALCAFADCKAFPMKKAEAQGHCTGHARSLGLIGSWSNRKKVVSDDAG